MKIERIETHGDDVAVTKTAPQRGDLSEDQREVYDTLEKWLEQRLDGDRSGKKFITLGGLAGTGKTTVVSAIAADFQGRGIFFTAFTGKAVDVLARKLKSYGINAPAATLHSLMYRPQFDEVTGQVKGWMKKPMLGLGDADDFERARVVIVDEASMLSSELWEDLLEYNIPVIAVGDHGQLPPVGSGAITLLAKPDLVLEKIHRQAADNPIIAFAHHVRSGGAARAFKAADDRVSMLVRVERPEVLDVLAGDPMGSALICYFNKTRCRYNVVIRRHRGYRGPDTVICLRNAERILYNGMRGVLIEIGEPDERGRALATIEFPEHGMRVTDRVCVAQFGREKTFSDLRELNAKSWSSVGLLFDYGYALTCHKSQGSQWKTVVVKHEVLSKDTEDTRRRWIYTAATRASERLYVA